MEQNVEFDREKLEAALRAGLDLNDCEEKDIESLLLNAEEEIEEEFDEKESSLNLAAIGGMYKLGDLPIKLVIGNYALLHTIESPFVSELEEGREIEFDDCCEAIYVLFNGYDAIEPVMHIQQKIKDMLRLRPLVKGNPDLIDKLLDRVEKISEARSQFTHLARDFYLNNFDRSDLQEHVEVMVDILNDAANAVNLTEEDQLKEKKNL